MQIGLLVFFAEMAAYAMLDRFVCYCFPNWILKPEARRDGSWKVSRPNGRSCFKLGFIYFAVSSSFTPPFVGVLVSGSLSWIAIICIIALDGLFVFGVIKSILLWRNAEIRWTGEEFQITGSDGKREFFRWENWAFVRLDLFLEPDGHREGRILRYDSPWDGMAEFKADVRIFAQRHKESKFDRLYDLLEELDAENSSVSRVT